MKYSKILFTLLFLLTALSVFSQQQVFTNIQKINQWDSIRKIAFNQDKFIFIELYSQNCISCEKMQENTFSDKKISSFLRNIFVTVKIPIDCELAANVIQNLSIKKVPTSFIFNWQSREVERYEGYISPEELTKKLDDFSSLYIGYLKLKDDYYHKNLDREKLGMLALVMSELNFYEESIKFSKEYLKKYKKLEYTDVEWKLINLLSEERISDSVLQSVISDYAKMFEYFGINKVNSFFSSIFENNYKLAVSEKNKILFDSTLFLIEVIKFSDEEFSMQRMKDFYKLEFYKETENWKKYGNSAVNYVEKYEVGDAELREIIYVLYLHDWSKTNLIKANSWAEDLYKKDNYYMNIMTLVFMQHRLSLNQRAVELLKEAKTKTTDKKNLELIDNLIREFGK
ncbi:MAG: thioredoxin family protein [Bacteroidota bacterium]|nr:thioredoxin family protein [Bacteroidota bacterium]